MKVDRQILKGQIEEIIAEGVINGEEIDLTTEKILEEIEFIVRAAERAK